MWHELLDTLYVKLGHVSDPKRNLKLLFKPRIKSLLGDIRARDAHGDANVGLLEGRRVVDAVTCVS